MRKIIHVDMDCFFAAVEVKEHPYLKGLPVAVGGQPEKRGVVAACNYEARRFGIHSAMSSSEALKRCPDLQLLPLNIERYKEVSQQVRAVFCRYTDLVEPMSLDEAYLDVSESTLFEGSATRIAQHIRASIFQELQLTASAGVAACKFLAKIASDENKPDGLYVVTPEEQDAFVQRLALAKIPGVGRVTQNKLERLGFNKCKDIQENSSLSQLSKELGSFGEVLWGRCHGVDNRGIVTHYDVKSVSVETTFDHDLYSSSDYYKALKILLVKLDEKLKQYTGKKVVNGCRVKVTFSDFQKTTAEQVSDVYDGRLFRRLLEKALNRFPGKGVRLIGVGANLKGLSPQIKLPLIFT